MLLSEQDPTKVARANKANSTAYKPALEKISNFDINWNIISYPNPSWAKQVFPDVSEDEAVRKLAMRSSQHRVWMLPIRWQPGSSTMPILPSAPSG